MLDLLQHYPRRWVDRTKRAEIAELAVGEEATVFAEVQHGPRPPHAPGRALVEVVVLRRHVAAERHVLQPGVAREAARGRHRGVVLRQARRVPRQAPDDEPGRRRASAAPGVADEKTGVIVPVYPQSGKAEVFTWQLRALVADALAAVHGARASPIRSTRTLLDRARPRRPQRRAARRSTGPSRWPSCDAAKRRLVFDEFLRMQVGLVAAQARARRGQEGIAHRVDGELLPAFLANLPFPLTGDQQRTIAEITRDMASHAPMHRLLQGDVGSGKTVVALAALLVAVQGGRRGDGAPGPPTSGALPDRRAGRTRRHGGRP